MRGARQRRGGRHERARRRARNEEGQGLVEYALIISLGALAVIAAMLFLANSIDDVFRTSGNATQVFTPPVVQCDASYEGGCVPPSPPDLDCDDIAALGIPRPVRVVGGDPHGLDPDDDGFGC